MMMKIFTVMTPCRRGVIHHTLEITRETRKFAGGHKPPRRGVIHHTLETAGRVHRGGQAGRDESRPYGMVSWPVSAVRIRHHALEAAERVHRGGQAGRDESRPYGVVSWPVSAVRIRHHALETAGRGHRGGQAGRDESRPYGMVSWPVSDEKFHHQVSTAFVFAGVVLAIVCHRPGRVPPAAGPGRFASWGRR